MHVKESKRATKVVLESLMIHLEDDLRGADDRELMEDCFGKIALHYVSHYEGEDVDDVDLWDLKVDGFEAGLKAAEKLKPGQKIYTVSINPDDIKDKDISLWCLWFAEDNDRELVKKIRAAFKIYRKIQSLEG